MTPELFLIPAALAALAYIFYQARDLIVNTVFVSLKIEELGSFLETTMRVLKNKVLNRKWAVGRFSMVKISTDEIKKNKEMDIIGLDAGVYFGKYKGRFVLVMIVDKVSNSFLEYMPRHPCIQITTFRWNEWILKDFLVEVKTEEKPIDVFATGFDYQIIRGRPRMGFNGLFLPNDLAKEIENLVRWFTSPEGEDWYRKMYQPYKLVILLHGCPGSGKTAVAKAIADVTGRSLVHMKLVSTKEKTDISHDTISFVVGSKNDVVLLDEIDKLFLEDTQGSKIDPGTLLALLNGDLLDGHILIMTANDLEKIPESFRTSMLRSRRVDRKYELNDASEDQKKAVCNFYNLPFTEDLTKTKTMAEVMELVMEKKQPPIDAWCKS